MLCSFSPLFKDSFRERRYFYTCYFPFLTSCSLLNPQGSGFYLQQPAKLSFTKITNDIAPVEKASGQFWFLFEFTFSALSGFMDYFLHCKPPYFVTVQDFKLSSSSLTTLPLLPSRALLIPSVFKRCFHGNAKEFIQSCALQEMHSYKVKQQWKGQVQEDLIWIWFRDGLE